jgi:hypothetical protein
VRMHYHNIAVASSCREPMQAPCADDKPSIVVVPLERWSTLARQSLEFACRLSSEVIGVHVEPGETDHAALLTEDWERYVVAPFVECGRPVPTLKLLSSPYRFVVIPIVQFVLELSKNNPTRQIVVVIPELVEERWYEYVLHNQRARLLEWMLLARGNERIFTVASPYYLSRANGQN